MGIVAVVVVVGVADKVAVVITVVIVIMIVVVIGITTGIDVVTVDNWGAVFAIVVANNAVDIIGAYMISITTVTVVIVVMVNDGTGVRCCVVDWNVGGRVCIEITNIIGVFGVGSTRAASNNVDVIGSVGTNICIGDICSIAGVIVSAIGTVKVGIIYGNVDVNVVGIVVVVTVIAAATVVVIGIGISGITHIVWPIGRR